MNITLSKKLLSVVVASALLSPLGPAHATDRIEEVKPVRKLALQPA